jgi:hypothetical protein
MLVIDILGMEDQYWWSNDPEYFRTTLPYHHKLSRVYSSSFLESDWKAVAVSSWLFLTPWSWHNRVSYGTTNDAYRSSTILRFCGTNQCRWSQSLPPPRRSASWASDVLNYSCQRATNVSFPTSIG